MNSKRAKAFIKTNAEIVFSKKAVKEYDICSYEAVKATFYKSSLIVFFDFLPIGASGDEFSSLNFLDGEVVFSDHSLCQVMMPFLNRGVKNVEDYTGCKVLIRRHDRIPGSGMIRLYAFTRRTVLVQGEE